MTRIAHHLMPGLLACLAAAQASADVRAFDFNDDGLISQGQEINAALAAPSQLTPAERITLQSAQDDGQAFVVITSIPTPGRGSDVVGCTLDQRFFLRRSSSDLSIYSPVGVQSTVTNDPGASFTLTTDHLTDQSQWSIDASLYYLLPSSDLCIGSENPRAPDGAYINRRLIAPFLDVAGRGGSDTDTTSTLSFGLYSEWQVNGGLLGTQTFAFRPYYRTDFDGEAEIFGLSASWQPVNVDWHLNAHPRSPGTNWQWNALLKADALQVVDAGSSGLAGDTNYAWVGVELGARVDFDITDARTGFLQGDIAHFYDLVGGTSATMRTAEIGVHLDERKTSSLSLLFEQGEDYVTTTQVDRAVLTFNLRF